MSREQWGHGYHKGVIDGISGKYDEKEILHPMFWVCHMNLSNIGKINDGSLYPVKELVTRMSLFYDPSEAKIRAREVYDFVMNKEPYLCYVSGETSSNWKDDYFVIRPSLGRTFWLRELGRVENYDS